MAIGKAPFIGCRLPSKDSSPIIIYSSICSDLICSEAVKIPNASVKSYAEPSLRKSAGAILIVSFFPGILYPLFCKAAAIL